MFLPSLYYPAQPQPGSILHPVQSEATQLLNVSSWRLAAATISQLGQIKSVPNVIYLKAGKTFRMYQRRRPPSTVDHHHINVIDFIQFLSRFIRVDISPIPRHTRACTGNVTSCCFAESRSFLNFDPAAVLQAAGPRPGVPRCRGLPAVPASVTRYSERNLQHELLSINFQYQQIRENSQGNYSIIILYSKVRQWKSKV